MVLYILVLQRFLIRLVLNMCMLVLTGNPGVGKHTTASEIMKQNAMYEIIDVNNLAIELGLTEKAKETLEVYVAELKIKMKQKVSKNSLIVGHLAPYVLDESDVDVAIVLRKNPMDLIKVFKDRGYSKEKIRSNTAAEFIGVTFNDSITSFGEEKTFQIDTTNKTPEQVTSIIDKIVHGKDKGDIVDWFHLVDKNAAIQELLDIIE